MKQITRVTADIIEYVDDDGEARVIDLAQCAGNWLKHHPDFETKWRKVGWRGLCRYPPVVELSTEPPTRFRFASMNEAYAVLLGPLRKLGKWHTFDFD